MLALDHIVIADENIELASKQFGENFSIKSIKGGKHPHWGTYNYLAYLSNDSYLEWLSVYDANIAEKSDNPLIIHLQHVLANHQFGAFQFALRTNKLDAFVDHFKYNDIPFFGPVEGRRTTLDGNELKWKMLFPKYDVTKTMLPFLIEWEIPSPYEPINDKQIKVLSYSGLSVEDFRHIYQINQDDHSRSEINLVNSQLQLTNDQLLLMFTMD